MKMLKIMTLFVVIILGACAQKDTGKLIVGMELAYPPFETKDNDGNPMGVSVDLAHELGAYLGKEVVIENIAWAGLIPALQTGKIDVIISSLTITKERTKQIDFSDPYSQSTLAMLVNINSPVNSLEDLNKADRIVAVKQGATPFLFAQKHLTNAKINSFASESAAVVEVVQGKADAVLYDQLTILKNYNLNPTTTKIVALDIAEEDIDVWGMGIKKGNTQLQTDINKFLTEFKADNGFSKITKKHLNVEKTEFDKYGLEFFF